MRRENVGEGQSSISAGGGEQSYLPLKDKRMEIISIHTKRPMDPQIIGFRRPSRSE